LHIATETDEGDSKKEERYTLLDVDGGSDKLKSSNIKEMKLLQVGFEEEKIEGFKDIGDSREDDIEEDEEEGGDFMDELEGM
jgi:hypothetical protein